MMKNSIGVFEISLVAVMKSWFIDFRREYGRHLGQRDCGHDRVGTRVEKAMEQVIALTVTQTSERKSE